MRWEDKDYVLRLIQEFGRFLRALRDAAGDEARQLLLDRRCRSICGLSLRAADGLSEESLLGMLPGEARLSMALLLSARAEAAARTETERLTYRHRALRLMLACREEEAVCGALAEAVDGLMRAALDQLTARELFDCALFLREGGRVDLMDNAVFFLWDTLPDRAVWSGRLSALYEGLSEQALADSGMGPEDVRDSLNRLRGN